MISIPVIGQLLTLALDTWQRIAARRAARESLSQGEKIRAALAQTDKNTQLYEQIVAEAQRQIAEQDVALKGNIKELEQLFGELKRMVKEG